MAFYYFDASALVKYYVTEPGSTWVRQLIEERDPETGQTRHVILVAEITRVEVAAGLAVIERVGRIRRSERDREYRRFTSQLAHRYAIIPLTTGDLETAAELTQHHPLKAYDAIQLAVALRSRQVLGPTSSPSLAAIIPSSPLPEPRGFLLIIPSITSYQKIQLAAPPEEVAGVGIL
jgi:predicted nucleic acid-binding protein